MPPGNKKQTREHCIFWIVHYHGQNKKKAAATTTTLLLKTVCKVETLSNVKCIESVI